MNALHPLELALIRRLAAAATGISSYCAMGTAELHVLALLTTAHFGSEPAPPPAPLPSEVPA